MPENVDTSISAHADRAGPGRGRFQQFTPVWAEVESRIDMKGTFPPSWYALLVIAGLIGTIGILTNSEILIVGAMVVGPEHGAILSLAFGMTRRDRARVRHSAAALVISFTLAVAGAQLSGANHPGGGTGAQGLRPEGPPAGQCPFRSAARVAGLSIALTPPLSLDLTPARG